MILYATCKFDAPRLKYKHVGFAFLWYFNFILSNLHVLVTIMCHSSVFGTIVSASLWASYCDNPTAF